MIHAMDAFAGAVGVSDSAGKGTPVYSICTPIGESNSHYYAHALREMSRNKWIEALAKGVRERSSDFRFTELGTQVLPIPLPDEQATIVRFLDHADEQIQRYIASKERLITLLEEERQALVHQAVTRGLDPNVRLKLSGVEWLGDVPEHWETVRLGSIGRFSKGNGGTKEDEVPAGVPCIRYGDIYTSHKYFINASRAYIKPEKTSEYTPLKFGDILLRRLWGNHRRDREIRSQRYRRTGLFRRGRNHL